VIQKGGANMNQDSKQQKQQDQYTNHEEGTQKIEQKNSTGYGDKKLNGPDIPST
jgi:hypothetical protein